MSQLPESDVERLAALVHDRLQRSPARPYRELPEHLREANRDSIRAIPGHLTALGYRLVPSDAVPSDRVIRLGDDEVERGAMLEHERWIRFMQRGGGASADLADLDRHPDLVPWEVLNEEAKDKDRVRVRMIPDLVAEVGLSVVPVSRGDTQRDTRDRRPGSMLPERGSPTATCVGFRRDFGT